ncbi:hypothetical protein TMEN_6256 [Trichophyton mentagrophytes]|uniref:Acyltransferase 3 n=2 Tax=Trichophyton interdigitale TaxID=101480 RepID=A0A9P4YI16_9EURO|nr:hypothetical protein H101_04656 [Trichophyton interdigitale H6]KAF3891716.1 Acyltransferase 3 [Trichophyton interdigitale]KDB21256.1 hypothetical protein H109_06782 [Trichophyton interdigitale MR816]GBF63621.1 hypothetical protein TMEN_6256 [Trichophyton mentagrophytes]KAF3897193.1 Acyltransferase 3 [Trichophyton interdigitale]
MASKAGPLAKPFIDTRWADGLRGIAALFVVASHVTLCFARSVMPPSISTDGPRRLFQNPYLRLIGQGNAAVSVFLVLLGFVNSLKTIQLIRSGCHQDALSTLSVGAFRRTGRLMLPATAATLVSFSLCNLGLYGLARSSDAYWTMTTAAAPSSTILEGIKSVAWEMIAVWIVGENRYDQPQWALAHLFKGSFFIYMVLLATASATPAFRLIALSILYAWGWIAGDTIVRPNVFAGMILAELTYLPTPKKSKVTTVLPYLVVALGLYLCSFPDRFADQAQWSRQLEQLGRIIFPKNAAMGRAWPNIGAQLLCFAVMYSPQMRHFLSHKWLHWIGSLSFALYLLHGMLMRTVLVWLVFGPNYLLGITKPGKLADGTDGQVVPQPGDLTVACLLPVFFAILLFVCTLWNRFVEPYFGYATAGLESFAKSFCRNQWPFNSLNSMPNGEKSILPTTRRD